MNKNHRIELLFVLVVALLGAAACSDHFTNELDAGETDGESADAAAGDADDGDVPLFVGLGVGESCVEADECRQGLDCVGGGCQPSGTGAKNDRCLLTAECADGLHCGILGFCVAAGAKKEGESCSSAAECERGLFCKLSGFAGSCTAPISNAGDIYAPCQEAEDCLAGLSCGANKVCVPGSIPLSPDLFKGAACPEPDDAALPFTGIVRVPRAEDDADRYDFFSVPFPNDIRMKDGKVDMANFPRPGLGLFGIDFVTNFLEAIEHEMPGYGSSQATYLRFSRPVLESTIVTEGNGQTVWLIELSTGAQWPIYTIFKPSRGKYICHNSLFVHPEWGRPLNGGETYAVIVSDGIRADLSGLPDADPAEGIPMQQGDLAELLSATQPADAALKGAWDVYAPLRDAAANNRLPIGLDRVVHATVFTVADARRTMAKLRGAVHATDMPVLESVTVCDGDNVSPCAENPGASAPNPKDPRDCPTSPNPDFTEVHAFMKIPVFQRGIRPYAGAVGINRAGEVELDSNGNPIVQGTEQLCVAISIPNKPPADAAKGYPFMVFAHGTGGRFNSGVDRYGAAMANLTDPDGAEVPTVVLSADQPMHANRRGGVDIDPGPLFYNFANPPAAKGNFYQGAADNFAIYRWAEAFDGNVGGKGLKLNKERFLFFGHSQGGTTGPIGLAYEENLHAAVFSGTGGSLVYSLLNKTEPFDATIGIRIMLQEIETDEANPVLNLFQMYFDEVDPLNYGELYGRDPLPSGPIHVLATYGHNDNFTPPATSRVFAASLRGTVSQPQPIPQWFDLMEDLSGNVEGGAGGDETWSFAPPPHEGGTIDAGGEKVTIVSVQHNNDPAQHISGPQEYDGHYVVFNHKLCVKQMQTFVQHAITRDGPPPVVD